MKILVVDDEKVLVKGICFNLRGEGYEVDGHDILDEKGETVYRDFWGFSGAIEEEEIGRAHV